MGVRFRMLPRLVIVTATVWFSTMFGCTSLIRDTKMYQEPAKVELPETVGELTHPYGLGSAAIESVGLITGLPGTGSDPTPSQLRQTLLDEMRRRKVANPNRILADDSTAIALVRAMLPPGTVPGDRIDVEVRVPRRSKTNSIEGGWLMETKLRDVAILNQEVHSGHIRGDAEGPVLVDLLMGDGDDQVSCLRGKLLGGGVATTSRPVGLMVRNEHHSVSVSKLIGSAINRRFDSYVRGKRQGAATPKTDKFIQLAIHPRYRHNLIRYMRVIEQIKVRESLPEQLERLRAIEGELLVPGTSSLASLKLEAIGDEAASTLKKGLDSPSAEVRFYSAEALAYLDQLVAARHLTEATSEPAFRSRALLALGAMSSVEAHDELTKLLHVESAETRYGAFRALQHMNPRDPSLGQYMFDLKILLHEIPSSGPPMVHVARSHLPEIVIFGSEQQLKTPLMILVGKKLIVKGESGSTLRVTRYNLGGDDETRVCTATVNDLLRTLSEVQTTYPEIVSVLQQVKAQGCLDSRLVFDAIPKNGRIFERTQRSESGKVSAAGP